MVERERENNPITIAGTKDYTSNIEGLADYKLAKKCRYWFSIDDCLD